LRETVLQGEPAPLIMELPQYHLPQFKTLAVHAWQRLKSFIFRAGRLIVPICIIIGVLNTLNVDGTLNEGEGDVNSLLSQLGLWLTPIFSPMGLRPENWPATVGLVTGILAKEVVIGTLNSIYSQVGHLQGDLTASAFHLGEELLKALQTIPANLIALKDAFINPVLAKAPIDPVTQGVYGLMVQRFDGAHGAFAYLLFVLLYVPCVSTTAAILRELDAKWAAFSAIWMTGVAYGTAVMFYQAATFFEHPATSASWIIGIVALFLFTVFSMRRYAHKQRKPQPITTEVTA
jgi:ferrous iron transport protein B